MWRLALTELLVCIKSNAGSWAELSTKADTLTFLLTSGKLNVIQNIEKSIYTGSVERGLQCFSNISEPTCRHTSVKAMNKYSCLGFLGGRPYKGHALVCWICLCNGLNIRADPSKARITCSTSSKIQRIKQRISLPVNRFFPAISYSDTGPEPTTLVSG